MRVIRRSARQVLLRRALARSAAAGGGDVMGGAGFDVADPHRETGRIGEHLAVSAVLLVLAGVPDVVAGTSIASCRYR